jgi:hypothetical protein
MGLNIMTMNFFQCSLYKEFTKFTMKYIKKELKYYMMGIILHNFTSYIMGLIGNFTAKLLENKLQLCVLQNYVD